MKTLQPQLQIVNGSSNLRLTALEIHRRDGRSIDEIAKAARAHPRYVAQVLRAGGASYVLAQRLARIYRAPITAFLFQSEGGPGTPRSTSARRGRNPRRALLIEGGERA